MIATTRLAAAARATTQAVVRMTNATKGQLIALVQSVIGLLQVFGVHLSYVQWGAIETVAGALFSVWVAATYKSSAKRIPEPTPGPDAS